VLVKVDLGVWDWLGRLIVVLLVGAAAVGLVAAYLPLIKENAAIRRTINLTRQEILAEQSRIGRLEADLEASKRPEIIEQLARDLADMARPGEVIFNFIGE